MTFYIFKCIIVLGDYMDIEKLKNRQKRRLYIFLKHNKLNSLIVGLISFVFFASIFAVIYNFRSIISILIGIILFVAYRYIFLTIYSVYNRWSLQIVRKNSNNIEYNIKDIQYLTYMTLISESIGYLFLIIPGIILSFDSSLKYFVYYDYNKLGRPFVVKETHRMLKGIRKDLYRLIISFIPLYLVSILTFGIGFVYYMPYYSLCLADFYEKNKTKLPF